MVKLNVKGGLDSARASSANSLGWEDDNSIICATLTVYRDVTCQELGILPLTTRCLTQSQQNRKGNPTSKLGINPTDS